MKREMSAEIAQIVSDVFALERQKADIQEEISNLKRHAFKVLLEKPTNIAWSKSALREAFRLMRAPKESRDVTLTQANKILREAGRGEIDLNAFC